MLLPPIGGILIDYLQPFSSTVGIANLGYRALHVLAGCCLLASCVLLYWIKLGKNVAGYEEHREEPLSQLDETETQLETVDDRAA